MSEGNTTFAMVVVSVILAVRSLIIKKMNKLYSSVIIWKLESEFQSWPIIFNKNIWLLNVMKID